MIWAAFSHDGAHIITASADETARVWDDDAGRELAILRGHAMGIGSVALSPDGTRLVTASSDHTARVWNIVFTAKHP